MDMEKPTQATSGQFKGKFRLGTIEPPLRSTSLQGYRKVSCHPFSFH